MTRRPHTPGSIPGYSALRSGPAEHAYNEAAFLHFLAIDRRRIERSLFLALITVRKWPTPMARFADAIAAAIFSGLAECVREADFVGWYREGHVAAAVLAQGATSSDDACHRVADRIGSALSKRLDANELANVRVRIVRLAGRVGK